MTIPWNKGKQWTPEQYEEFYKSEKVQKAQAEFRIRVRKPMSEEQRAKISAAHQDVPKTEMQRVKMSETQRRRQELKRQLIEANPSLSVDQVWEKVKELMHE